MKGDIRDIMQNYDIRDISLAPSGHQKIEWVRNNMPLLRGLEEEFRETRPFEGIKISLSVHLEAKTAYLCLVLASGGAQMRRLRNTTGTSRCVWNRNQTSLLTTAEIWSV